MNPELIHVPFEVIDDEIEQRTVDAKREGLLPDAYAIAAIHIATNKRYLIKVNSLATREQLLKEVRLMNFRPGQMFMYSLSTEGAAI